MISIKFIRTVTTIAMILALFVVMLGAYTRLTDAGLGCPDWPGCYGHLVLPAEKASRVDAQRLYPNTPIESRKAWTEMAHRYAAGTLGLLILTIALGVSALRRRKILVPWLIPAFLILLLSFQAALGMWTVTLKLLPVVVMGHLLGGMLIFASLCYFRLQLSSVQARIPSTWCFWIGLGAVLVFCQIALGGWVSSNYAGIACIGFPRCNGQWLPPLDFSQGFNLFSPVGENYQGGVLDSDVRVTIQFIHRLGAVVAGGYVLLLSLMLLCRVKIKTLRYVTILAISLVTLQITLGIVNVLYLLPLWVAVAHNGIAAVLLATLFAMRYLAGGANEFQR